MFSVKNILYVVIVIVYLLHNDLWFWDNPTLVMGIPVGLFYHLLYCFIASILLFLLIKFAWPKFVEEVDKDGSDV
jgi:nitric oxide reductase large subunit